MSDATDENGTDAAAGAAPRAAPTTSAAGGGGAPATGDPAAGAMSFEESTRRLARIVAELEGGDLPLERALSLFEEGIRLSRSAQERLDRAEKRVEELLGMDADGRPVTREFEG